MTGPALPLAGRGIAITRAEAAPGPLERRLAARGARVLRWAAVELAPAADPRPLASALARLEDFDWIVFASAHAVEVVAERVERLPPTLRVAAVGSATARELERVGWRVDRLPERFGADGLVESFRADGDAAGARVLLPASAIGRQEISEGLTALGARVARVEAYRTLAAALDAERCRAALAAGEVDAVTFASPSAVDGLAAALGEALFTDLLGVVAVAVIGPTTAGTLLARGRTPDAEAAPHTLDGLVAAVERALAARPPRRAAAAVAASDSASRSTAASSSSSSSAATFAADASAARRSGDR